ncbi:NAD-dependent epimerase/dehydratase family protein [Rhodobacterales bacterium FZCC0188]|nr:NAD-dependent epimerase/dehydratase family protein [Rhodobacterales bacterium FZCC0188]
MRIVIAGASGFVGQMLVPELRARGADVMLLGRDPEALQAKFPECAVSDYANLSQVLQGADLLLNLAVVNSDAGASLSAYQAVNVEFAATLAQAAQDAGGGGLSMSAQPMLWRQPTDPPMRKANAMVLPQLTRLEEMSCISICPRFMGRHSQARCAI